MNRYVSTWKEFAENVLRTPEVSQELERKAMDETRSGAAIWVPKMVWVARKQGYKGDDDEEEDDGSGVDDGDGDVDDGNGRKQSRKSVLSPAKIKSWKAKIRRRCRQLLGFLCCGRGR